MTDELVNKEPSSDANHGPSKQEPINPASITFPWEMVVDESQHGKRLDAVLAKSLSNHSRTHLRRAIDAGHVNVDGEKHKPSLKVSEGMVIRVEQLAAAPEGPEPEEIPLDILYEDDDLAVVNKPPNMVVHPAKGHWAGTLASALAFHFGKQLSQTGGSHRPGIVHRLDRDTSGVIVVAKHDQAHQHLSAQFQNRTVEKTYLALVQGIPDRDGDRIDQPIGPHPKIREKMAIRPDHPDARQALTLYEVVDRYQRFALIRCKPKTGRTHQIRVHLAHIGNAVLCDKQYGGRSRVTLKELMGGLPLPDEEPLLERQALHAAELAFEQPTTGERLRISAPIPDDIQRVLTHLKAI